MNIRDQLKEALEKIEPNEAAWFIMGDYKFTSCGDGSFTYIREHEGESITIGYKDSIGHVLESMV